MIKTNILACFLLVLHYQTIAQQVNYKDSIETGGNFFTGLRFYQHDRKLNMHQLTMELNKNPEATKYLNKAKINNTLGFIFSFTGGFIVGYQLGRAIGGKDINWAVMAVGFGSVAISIPFDSWYRRNAKKAVTIYNGAYR